MSVSDNRDRGRNQYCNAVSPFVIALPVSQSHRYRYSKSYDFVILSTSISSHAVGHIIQIVDELIPSFNWPVLSKPDSVAKSC